MSKVCQSPKRCQSLANYNPCTGVHIKKLLHSPGWRATYDLELPAQFYTRQYGTLFEAFSYFHPRQAGELLQIYTRQWKFALTMAIWRRLCTPLPCINSAIYITLFQHFMYEVSPWDLYLLLSFIFSKPFKITYKSGQNGRIFLFLYFSSFSGDGKFINNTADVCPEGGHDPVWCGYLHSIMSHL